jgi:hypothetical protein
MRREKMAFSPPLLSAMPGGRINGRLYRTWYNERKCRFDESRQAA